MNMQYGCWAIGCFVDGGVDMHPGSYISAYISVEKFLFGQGLA